MPGMSGDEVLERIRGSDHDPKVAMVTAVAPDFDHYVSKPVDGGTLGDVIERLLELDRYDDRLNDLYGVMERIGALEAEKTNSELADTEVYATLVERRNRLEATMDDLRGSFDDADRLFEAVTEPEEWDGE